MNHQKTLTAAQITPRIAPIMEHLIQETVILRTVILKTAQEIKHQIKQIPVEMHQTETVILMNIN